MDDRTKKHIEMLYPLVETRGYVITATIKIESLIDSIIVSYYAKKDANIQEKFHNDILKKMNMRPKLEVLRKALNYVNIKEEKISELKGLLTEITKTRNEVAHWNWSEISDQDEITLFKEKGDPSNVSVIGPEDLTKFREKCEKATGMLAQYYVYRFDPPKNR